MQIKWQKISNGSDWTGMRVGAPNPINVDRATVLHIMNMRSNGFAEKDSSMTVIAAAQSGWRHLHRTRGNHTIPAADADF